MDDAEIKDRKKIIRKGLNDFLDDHDLSLSKQNTERILELRRDALQRIINFSVISLLIFVTLVLVFSLRLAGRIRRLGAEANNAIDIYGRLKTNQLKAETQSGDEIGDLARSISGTSEGQKLCLSENVLI